MSIVTSRPESVKLHFISGWTEDCVTLDNIHSVEWHEHMIRVRLGNHNSVSYPYRELRLIEEFDDNPTVVK